MWYIHVLEYYSALETKKILSHATTCLNLENVTNTVRMAHLREGSKANHRNRKSRGRCPGLGEGLGRGWPTGTEFSSAR